MATGAFTSTNAALRVATTMSTWPNGSKDNGKVYCMSDECYATSTGTAGSTMYAGGLPRGANVLFSVIWPIDTATYGEGDAMTAGATGQLGTVASTNAYGDAIAADPDLFGDVAALTTATPQVIEPCPDGTIYTTTLDMALQHETTPVMLTATQNVINTEGIALKILYTMGGRTS